MITNRPGSRHLSSTMAFLPSSPDSLDVNCQNTSDRLSGMCNRRGCKQRWLSQGSRAGLYLGLFFISFICPTLATMEITAFEYNRKFHKTLDLGECCQREIAVTLGNKSLHIEKQKCSLYQRGTITHIPHEFTDVKNVLIPSADVMVHNLGLCGGDAASFLGILNSGDCVAIEIASRLSFQDKTMVRAFVETYQNSMDTLEGISNNLEGMERYYKDKFYLLSRSYGTLEILLVQFRFDSVLATQEAKKIKQASHLMSSYMKQIRSQIGRPKSVLVIDLSTATQQPYKIQQFSRPDWDRALRHVEIAELNIQRTLNQISANIKQHHLLYKLHPFLEENDYRSSLPIHWEEISKLEVQLRQSLKVAKTTALKCRGNRSKLCRRVRQLKKKLTTAQVDVHKRRAKWVTLTPDERSSLASTYQANVNSYISVTKNLAKSVREMKKHKQNRKPDILNEIPRNTEEQIKKRQRRMRSGKRSNKIRSGDVR